MQIKQVHRGTSEIRPTPMMNVVNAMERACTPLHDKPDTDGGWICEDRRVAHPKKLRHIMNVMQSLLL